MKVWALRSQHAAELKQSVGAETLQRAYFSGDAEAIRKVSAAIVDIWPKAPTHTAWQAIRDSRGGHGKRTAAGLLCQLA